jgi:hypothetical protein
MLSSFRAAAGGGAASIPRPQSIGRLHARSDTPASFRRDAEVTTIAIACLRESTTAQIIDEFVGIVRGSQCRRPALER